MSRLQLTPPELRGRNRQVDLDLRNLMDQARAAAAVRAVLRTTQFEGYITELSPVVLAKTRLGRDTSEDIARELAWDIEKKENLIKELVRYIYEQRLVKLEKSMGRLSPELRTKALEGRASMEELAVELGLDPSKHSQYLAQLMDYVVQTKSQ